MKLLLVSLVAVLAVARAVAQPDWHFSVQQEFNGTQRLTQLWLPPDAPRIRGVMLFQDNWAEPGMVLEPGLRAAAARAGLAILYCERSCFSANWDPETDGVSLQQLLTTYGTLTGIAEFRHLPWLPVGHSAIGPMAQRIAFWKPERTIAVIHYKSGNLQNNVPAGRSSADIAAVPFLAINGQFEEYGPNGSHSAGDDWEEQWQAVQADLLLWRANAPGNRVFQIVEPGAGHFAWSGRLAQLVGDFIVAATGARVGDAVPASAPIPLTVIPEADGWLSSSDIYSPQAPAPAAFGGFGAAASTGWWHLDGGLATRWADSYAGAFPPDPDGGPVRKITFAGETPRADYSPVPATTAYNKANQLITVNATSKDVLPVKFLLEKGAGEQVGPNQFRLNAAKYRYSGRDLLGSRFAILGYQEATASTRYAERTAEVLVSKNSGTAQTITFPLIPDVTWPCDPIPLFAAASSGLPVDFAVISGPATIVDGMLHIHPLPRACRVAVAQIIINAGQFGNATHATAESVSRSFLVTYPPQPVIALSAGPEVRLDWSQAPGYDTRFYYTVEQSASLAQADWAIASGPTKAMGSYATAFTGATFFRVRGSALP